jgi:sodium transport system permease protein
VNWSAVRTVLAKELRETLRDRRTLIIMIVVPVLLYPAMLILMEQITLFGQRTLEADAVRVSMVNAPPELVRFLDADAAVAAVVVGTVPREALRRGTTDAIIVFPPTWTDTGTNRLVLLFDGTRDRSGHARGLLESRLREWIDTLRVARLERHGLPPSLAWPLQVEQTSIATPEAVGGYMLGRFLPLLLIMMTLLGAFYPSIDLAAGEKERGTLEPLLTVPVHADDLVIGKFAAAATMGLTAATLNLASMLLTFQAGIVQFGAVTDIQFHLPAYAVLVIFGVLALLAILFASLFLGIAVRSHSFKEAQNALTPVYMLAFLPAILPLIPGIGFGYAMAVLPVAGVAFLFRDLMSGTAQLGTAVVAVAATVLYAAIALGIAARAFGREDVLFGAGDSGARGGALAWLPWRRSGGTRVPTPAAAMGLVGAIAVLYFYGARPLVLARGENGLLLAQLAFLAVPVVLFVLLGRFAGRDTLALRVPTPRAFAGAVLIIAGGIPIGWTIAWLQTFVLEIPVDFLEALQRLVQAGDARRLFWLLLVLALTPAVCEELVFRGVLLGSFTRRFGMAGSIAGSALVFAAFHLSTETLIRFLPTAWLGLLLGFVVWHTRSIWPAMLMHFVNNGVVIVLVSLPFLHERVATAGGQPALLPVLAAPLLLLVGLRLLPRRVEDRTTGR